MENPKKELTITSVKINSKLWDEFRISCVRHKFSLQKLADRTIHLYISNDEFRKMIHNHHNLDINE
jgi:hypothetical protein